MLRDVVELRDNKWIPRREENYNPKTFDQIHKEAELEKKVKKRLAAKLSAKKLESEVKVNSEHPVEILKRANTQKVTKPVKLGISVS